MTPGLKQPKEVCGKEIVALQTLSSISPVIKSEDLQSLVHEITSAVEGAKTWTSTWEEETAKLMESELQSKWPGPAGWAHNPQKGPGIVVDENPVSRRSSSIFF